uniref:(northern house mosquito) hypothetical protein n=1 Tax=Culex pipiens TaxID=7175 RepID=A0A8D8BZ49_CULPI
MFSCLCWAFGDAAAVSSGGGQFGTLGGYVEFRDGFWFELLAHILSKVTVDEMQLANLLVPQAGQEKVRLPFLERTAAGWRNREKLQRRRFLFVRARRHNALHHFTSFVISSCSNFLKLTKLY